MRKFNVLLALLLSCQAYAIDIKQCSFEREFAFEAIDKFLSGVPLALVMDSTDDYREQVIYAYAYRWNGSWVDFPYYIENMCYRRQLNID